MIVIVGLKWFFSFQHSLYPFDLMISGQAVPFFPYKSPHRSFESHLRPCRLGPLDVESCKWGKRSLHVWLDVLGCSERTRRHVSPGSMSLWIPN